MSISLFLGAGASAQFEMDTTSEFKSRLLNNQKLIPEKDPTHPNLPPTITSLIKNKNFRDIEEILYAIKELRKNIISPNDFPPYAKLAWDELTVPENPPFKPNLENLSRSLMKIESRIIDEVFNAYNWNPSNNSILESFYSRLFQIILKNSRVINIGTTNYDQAIENFCELPNSKYTCHDGFYMQGSNLRSVFSEDNFELKNTDVDKFDVRLFKIHGSLNWKSEGDEFLKVFGNKSAIGQGERVFISPTLNPKEDVKKEPFNSLNNQFKKYLQESQICVIIGYSFRDEHINRNFEDFLKNKENKIIVVSPSCKSNFVRNFRKIKSENNSMDDAWLQSNKPKNIHFLEYRIEKDTRETVLSDLEQKISSENSKKSENNT